MTINRVLNHIEKQKLEHEQKKEDSPRQTVVETEKKEKSFWIKLFKPEKKPEVKYEIKIPEQTLMLDGDQLDEFLIFNQKTKIKLDPVRIFVK